MNNQNITISVIIIGYNTKNYLVGLLHSIKKQNIFIPQKNIEIIYVDDGSNDGSIEIFRSFPLNFKKKHFRFINNSIPSRFLSGEFSPPIKSIAIFTFLSIKNKL